ncbi:MAG: sugar ABC transporter permease [Anaerotignum sp.]|nr:sugar ABC transporter permease [Anaerotignum sp.]MBQ3616023.1 sugar ABC transporter permease [Anaerotignum sp.]MBQ7084985.1 sugar ABC transporter permease [Anaerotignum sp.]MBR2383122.1 sugar ABC transporter permease [Anaerotignum sp.]MBR2851364.1 sugar ABC transporter permease [Anaerotignum sp.]
MEKALKRWFPIFVAPTLAAFCVGFIWPFIHGLYLSFCQFTTVDNAKFVGVDNYVRALTDTSFIDSFWFTVAFVIVATLIINVTAFAIALALTKELKGTNIFRTVFFMPNLIGGIVLGYIWQTLFNAVLMKLGEPLLALNTQAGYWGLIILLCWQQIGYMMIIYVAGLQNVPPDLMEAASIDGASSWQTLWKVKLPMVMPSITICLFLTITNAFKLFDQNLSLTAGDPAHTTEMMALNIYYTFYARAGAAWKGIGQAKAVVFFILVVIIGLTQLRATRSKEVQQ